MISNEKMEEYWNRYREQAVPKNISMQAFCSMNNIPYNAFEKYLQMRRHFSTVHKINVTDIPEDESSDGCEDQNLAENPQSSESSNKPKSIRIMVDIRISNGLRIEQRNLDHKGLLSLVEKLEALC